MRGAFVAVRHVTPAGRSRLRSTPCEPLSGSRLWACTCAGQRFLLPRVRGSRNPTVRAWYPKDDGAQLQSTRATCVRDDLRGAFFLALAALFGSFNLNPLGRSGCYLAHNAPERFRVFAKLARRFHEALVLRLPVSLAAGGSNEERMRFSFGAKQSWLTDIGRGGHEFRMTKSRDDVNGGCESL